MPNLILIDEGWESRVRSVMGVDSAYLPDEDLRQPDCISLAEANIINMVPDYAELEGSDKIRLEAATVLECAILLCPSMPVRLPVEEKTPHLGHKLEVDWDKRMEKFIADRDKNLAAISTVEGFSGVSYFGLSR